MTTSLRSRLEDRAARGTPLADDDALALADVAADRLAPLLEAARATRERVRPRTLTYSPKVFLPLTNLCRNRCDYCSFRKSPGDPGEWTMRPDEVADWLERGRAEGAVEALFCLGDKPEGAFSSYRRTLEGFGHASTVDYLVAECERALSLGLLPHTNAGVLGVDEMRRLRRVNASLGLMLENVSPRLAEPGMPHHKAPDKRPERRVAMIDEAGALAIPFTTGVLVGIGETRRERVESLLAIRALALRHGHVQEVIVQNFRARPEIGMSDAIEADDDEMAHAIAMARLVLPDEISVQAPPNLNASRTALLVSAGLDDFGGISPVTPDYINPRHPWPHLDALGDACARLGFALRPRTPVHARWLADDRFFEPSIAERTRAIAARLARVERAADLVPALGRGPVALDRELASSVSA